MKRKIIPIIIIVIIAIASIIGGKITLDKERAENAPSVSNEVVTKKYKKEKTTKVKETKQTETSKESIDSTVNEKTTESTVVSSSVITQSTETTIKENTTKTYTSSVSTTSEKATQIANNITTEKPVTSTSAKNEPYVGKVKNGTLNKDNGFYYITDDSTGTKFVIVNKTYALPNKYAASEITPECKSAFNRMVEAAKNDGISITLISGIRSYDYQNNLYNKYCARDGKKAADTYSARPGHSEHQTGLAIDCNSLSTSWADTKEGKWLASHCTEYGFIIRYAKGKEAMTGYQYEPWHIRYLGNTELCKKITDSGLCVEEYYGISSKYAD